MENFVVNRKKKVEEYIAGEYKATNSTYTSLLYGETTVVKPMNFVILDSLYNVKYNNERQGLFEEELEEKIGNQKQIIQRDTTKVIYIEHHVYAITDSINSEINFADISIDPQLNVKDFKISEQHIIPKDLLPIYEAYLSEESIVHPTYLATSSEHELYRFYKSQYEALSFAEREDFLVHTLKVFQLARAIRTIDTETLLKSIGIKLVFDRNYDRTVDNFKSIDGLFVDDVLIGYIANLETIGEKYVLKFSPYLELETVQKVPKEQ